ncbi:MAG: DUF6781 family protein [Betaproteobacteria bacterium]
MLKLPMDPDAILRQLTSESVRKGEDIRTTVRDLTLKALHGRQLTLVKIREVLRTVTEGVNMGALKSPVDPSKSLADAMAGMDDALLKAVEANRVALQRLTSDGQSFEESQMKKALDELERYEDTLLRTVKQASSGAGDQLKAQWASVLKATKLEGTDTGAQVAATIEEYGDKVQGAIRETRTTGFKFAHALTRNYTTLLSGVLIGLSEGLRQQGAQPGRPAPAAPTPAAAPAARTAPATAPTAAKPPPRKTVATKTVARKTVARKTAAKKPAGKKSVTAKTKK